MPRAVNKNPGKVEKTWEFPKIRDTLFWGPYNKDPTVYGTILGSPIFGNSHILQVWDCIRGEQMVSRDPWPRCCRKVGFPMV